MRYTIATFRKTFFAPFLGAILFVGLMGLVTAWQMRQSDYERTVEQMMQQSQHTLNQKMIDQSEVMKGVARAFVDNPAIIGAWERQDREELYHATQSLFAFIKDHYRMSHLYFIAPDRTIFLRMHEPQTFGDSVKRSTLLMAESQKQTVSGIDYGIHNRIVLRTVVPIEIRGHFMGYIEVGQDLRDFLDDTARFLACDVTLLGYNKDLNRAEYFTHFPDRSRYKVGEDYFVLGTTLTKISSVEMLLQDDGKFMDGYTHRHYVMKTPFYDSAQKKIGVMVFLYHSESDEAYFYYTLALNVTIFILVLTLMGWIYRQYITRLQKTFESYEYRLQEQATTDPLTGLHNRRYFDQTRDVVIASATRLGAKVAFLMVDVDHFKLYNDHYGHHAGDKVLHDVATILKKVATRQNDLVIRLGGEEFGLLAVFKDGDDIESFGQALCDAVASLGIVHAYNDTYGIVTISVGICVLSSLDHENFASIYTKADGALYKAKQTGRNRVVMCG